MVFVMESVEYKHALSEWSEAARFVRVKVLPVNKIYLAETSNFDLTPGEEVLIAKENEIFYGIIVSTPRTYKEEILRLKGEIYTFLRKLTYEDRKKLEENAKKEEKAFKFCKEKIKDLDLPMHLVNCNLNFIGKQYTFYFTSETRVDFRELVQILSEHLRARIQLWQIGSRDETRFFPNIGICGRQLCCNTFLKEIKPVTLRCVKEQGISINPAKVTGICGRLMCCLRYEINEEENSKDNNN